MNFIRLLSVVFLYLYHAKDDKIENRATKFYLFLTFKKHLKNTKNKLYYGKHSKTDF